jgi:hypothetical protein
VPRRLSQRNQAAHRDTVVVDGWHELSVANPTFLLAGRDADFREQRRRVTIAQGMLGRRSDAEER